MPTLPAAHTFLPWARRGLATEIQETEIYFGGTNGTPAQNERPSIKAWVHVKVNNNAVPSTPPVPLPMGMDFEIIGPGDIIGLHPDAIVKTEPLSWCTNFEPHSFPFIDFYEEDFPWRYTPAVPVLTPTVPSTSGGRLRPWITLVVLKEDEFTRKTVEGAPLTAIVLKDETVTPVANRPLPKNDEVWAWAHVSVEGVLSGSNLNDSFNAKVNDNPNSAISRIICPRQLEENTSYYAFLIPTYETGRLSGLNLPTTGVKAQAPSWDHSTNWTGQNSPPQGGTFPVYYEWYFRTGATGDFEYLIRQLQPQPLDDRVGSRLIDISSPGYGLFFTGGPSGSTQGAEYMEGALRAPIPADPEFPQTQTERTFHQKLADFVNLGADMLDVPTANSMYYQAPNYATYPANDPNNAGTLLSDDPIVAPPLYGRWHALKKKINYKPQNSQAYWIDEANHDPRYRLAASLGGDFVRKNQEHLMNEAWKQVGDVIEANRQALIAQLALQASQAMHKKSLEAQPVAKLLSMTSSVQAKIKTGTSSTLKQDTIDSSMADGATSSAFRKISRPTGVMMKRMDTITYPSNPVEKMRTGSLAPVAAKQAPGATAATFDMTTLSAQVNSISTTQNPAGVSFNITVPGGGTVAASGVVSANFAGSFSPFTNVFDTNNWQQPGPQPNLGTTASVISDALDPAVTHVKGFYDTVDFEDPPQTTPDAIVPVMAAPAFNIPMYESLKETGLEYFIPNLNLLPQNSITLFVSNQKFIEAYMLGANYEMGRELLWREYPTDQRGTYFKHFWSGTDSLNDEDDTKDISPIHEWLSNSYLGGHTNRTGADPNNLVLAIRGDFLKKFPNAVIYATPAAWDTTNFPNNYWDKTRILPDPETGNKYPIFQAQVGPDITFLGFDIDQNTATGDRVQGGSPGYFFVFMERPGELRFGLDFDDGPPPSTITNWEQLTWSMVTTNNAKYLQLNTPSKYPSDVTLPPLPDTGEATNWGDDSGAMAMILYQNPVKVAIHAVEMIP